MKLLIIGGVAAGASAAARARRMDDFAEITVLERGPYVSFANCGLPYYVGGDIADREDLLLVSPEMFRERFHIDVRLHHAVTAIHRDRKCVTVSAPGKTVEMEYDRLIIAPGCEPVVPKIPGGDLRNISTVFTISDVDRITAALGEGVKSAVVVGGGFIGIETAEGLLKRGIDTTLVERCDQLMTIFDPEFAEPLRAHLESAGLKVRLGTSVKAFRGEGKVSGAELSDGTVLPADLVIMAAGLRPNTELAQQAGLAVGATGGIVVNRSMQTSDSDIYAAGDAVESFHIVSGAPVRVSLASNANRQGRIAGNNAVGGALRYHGTLATSIIRVWDITAARTGLTEAEATAAGFEHFSVLSPANSNAGYFPGGGWMILKVTAEKSTGRILGAQCVGEAGVDKRIDVIAAAIHGGMTVFDLEDLDLAYAPPYSSARGPEIIAGMIAANVVRGDIKTVMPADLPAFLEKTGAVVLDIREPGETAHGIIEGSLLIPLDTLRADPEQLDRSKTYVISCGVGKRAHNACRFLMQHGYDVYNLTGGWNGYTMDV